MTEPQANDQPNLHALVLLHTRDGRLLRVRHMRSEDAALLERMFYRLSAETLYRRFFVPLGAVEPEQLQRETKRLATLEPGRATALLVLDNQDGYEEAVAVARYSVLRDNADSCEGSIVVRDDYQRVGLGRQLFDLLVQVALAQGLRHLVLLTHADNSGLIALVQSLGLPYRGRYSAGLYEIDVQLSDGVRPFFPFTSL